MREIKLLYNCIFCGNTEEIIVKEKDYEAYLRGEGHIQEIFPYLTADQREIMISGICGKCFDGILEDDDEDEEAV